MEVPPADPKEELKWKRHTVEMDIQEIHDEMNILKGQLHEKEQELRKIKDQQEGRSRSHASAAPSSASNGSQQQQQQATSTQLSHESNADTVQPVAARDMSEAVAEKLRDVAVANIASLSEDAAGGTIVFKEAQAGANDVDADWVCAMSGYRGDSDSTPRIALSFAIAAPEAAGSTAAMVWGIAYDGSGGWEEPPEGWRTVPDTSVDNGIGAWLTTAEAAGSFEDAESGQKLTLHKLLIDMPWDGTFQKQGGVPFKWQVGEEWLGAAESGDNLVAQAHFAYPLYGHA